jgi:hypothetical protein
MLEVHSCDVVAAVLMVLFEWLQCFVMGLRIVPSARVVKGRDCELRENLGLGCADLLLVRILYLGRVTSPATIARLNVLVSE